MIAMGRVAVSLMAVVLTALGSYAESQSAQATRMAFSLPFTCGQRIPGEKKNAKVVCLADSFEPDLDVVLVGKKCICSAKTATTFTFEHVYHKFEVTGLSASQECGDVGAGDEIRGFFAGFYMAIVGADPTAVRVVSVMDDRTPVPKKIEQEARKTAARHIEGPNDSSDDTEVTVTISDLQPRVLRAENVTLLVFQLQIKGDDVPQNPWAPGPTVAWTNAGVFLFGGACTYGEPKFFSINDKLYVTYKATVDCCGCGDMNFFVYDLSGKSPKLVYHNNDFSE